MMTMIMGTIHTDSTFMNNDNHDHGHNDYTLMTIEFMTIEFIMATMTMIMGTMQTMIRRTRITL